MKLVILGGGESGIGTALLGKQKGYDVFVSDFGVINNKYKSVLIDNNINFEDGGHTSSKIVDANIVMKSPGIPDKASIIQEIVKAKIPIVSEIEFAIQYTNAKTIGITGSNGKTTTTLLTYHLLKTAGFNVGIGGNIGKSFAWQVATEKFEYYVLELSSFQLDGIVNYRPDIAIITNLSPDHLDRYDYDYNNYIEAKFRITMNQTPNDYLIYDADDTAIATWMKHNKVVAKTIPFSITQKLTSGVYLDNKQMKISKDISNFEIETSELSLEGNHNLKNAMASAAVAKILQVRNDTLRKSIGNFEGAAHRLEKVAKLNGVQYINDSKATNVNSVFYALDSMNVPTVWIVGGVDKGNDYDELTELVHQKVKAIICIGVDNEKIINHFKKFIDMIVEVDTMQDAVKTAQKLTVAGDNVLLAPACASFDRFKSYEDRGNQFKDAVHKL